MPDLQRTQFGRNHWGRVSHQTTPIATESYLMGLGIKSRQAPIRQRPTAQGPKRIRSAYRFRYPAISWYAVGTLVAFAVIGVILAWRG